MDDKCYIFSEPFVDRKLLVWGIVSISKYFYAQYAKMQKINTTLSPIQQLRGGAIKKEKVRECPTFSDLPSPVRYYLN